MLLRPYYVKHITKSEESVKIFVDFFQVCLRALPSIIF